MAATATQYARPGNDLPLEPEMHPLVLNKHDLVSVGDAIGAASDLIKMAMVRLQAREDAGKLPGRLLLQVHDELVFELPEADVAAAVPTKTTKKTAAPADQRRLGAHLHPVCRRSPPGLQEHAPGEGSAEEDLIFLVPCGQTP